LLVVFSCDLLVIGFAVVGVVLPPSLALTLASVAATAGVFALGEMLSTRPLLRRNHELGEQVAQLEKLKQCLEQRLMERDRDLAATNAKLGSESTLRERVEAKARELGEELERRVSERTAHLDKAKREQEVEIQEQKRLVDVLRENEKRYRHLVEIANAGIWTLNTEGKTNYANPKMAEALGYAVPEMLGRPTDQFVFMEDLPQGLRSFDLQRGTPLESLEFRMRHKAGTDVWVRAYLSAIFSDGGDYLGALVLFVDLTTRKRNEDRLRDQAALLEAAQDAMVICDPNLHILSWSPSAVRLYGWTGEEVMGRDWFQLFSDTATPSSKSEVLTALRLHGRWRGELCQVAKDGRRIEVDARVTAGPVSAGKPASLLLLANDITERKKHQAQINRDQRIETASNLIAGLAHELNNTLSPILLSAQVLRSKRLSPEDDELAAGIETSAERGADLMRQALIFARGVEGERIVVQPGLLLRDIAEITREMLPRNVQVLTDIPTGLWSFKGDPARLHQALLKLCVNARDAMANGGILWLRAANRKIDSTAGAQTTPGRYLLLAVQDTGRGIPLAVQERIFEPFFSTKERCQATGLGLAVVMGIIRSHGGSIDVHSQPGAGTTFSILLPAMETPPVTSEPSHGLPVGRGELILMVEDEAGLRDVTRTMLNRYGYEVLAAGDGVEALGLLAQHQGRVKLVLTNLSMSAMDGPSLARAARRIDPRLRIIASSAQGGSVQQTDKLAALQSLGISRLLAKPYSANELLRAIRDELRDAPAG
jgi:PAS domain S-box-containing protein